MMKVTGKKRTYEIKKKTVVRAAFVGLGLVALSYRKKYHAATSSLLNMRQLKTTDDLAVKAIVQNALSSGHAYLTKDKYGNWSVVFEKHI